MAPFEVAGGLVLHELVPYEGKLSDVARTFSLGETCEAAAGMGDSVVFLLVACGDRLEFESLCKLGNLRLERRYAKVHSFYSSPILWGCSIDR